MKTRLYMPEISEEELVEHIEDDDFLLVYGNPVLIRSKDGEHDCVLMSIQYYNRVVEIQKQMEKDIADLIERNQGAK